MTENFTVCVLIYANPEIYLTVRLAQRRDDINKLAQHGSPPAPPGTRESLNMSRMGLIWHTPLVIYHNYNGFCIAMQFSCHLSESFTNYCNINCCVLIVTFFYLYIPYNYISFIIDLHIIYNVCMDPVKASTNWLVLSVLRHVLPSRTPTTAILSDHLSHGRPLVLVPFGPAHLVTLYVHLLSTCLATFKYSPQKLIGNNR